MSTRPRPARRAPSALVALLVALGVVWSPQAAVAGHEAEAPLFLIGDLIVGPAGMIVLLLPGLAFDQRTPGAKDGSEFGSFGMDAALPWVDADLLAMGFDARLHLRNFGYQVTHDFFGAPGPRGPNSLHFRWDAMALYRLPHNQSRVAVDALGGPVIWPTVEISGDNDWDINGGVAAGARLRVRLLADYRLVLDMTGRWLGIAGEGFDGLRSHVDARASLGWHGIGLGYRGLYPLEDARVIGTGHALLLTLHLAM